MCNNDKQVHSTGEQTLAGQVLASENDADISIGTATFHRMIELFPHPVYIIDTNDFSIKQGNRAAFLEPHQIGQKCHNVIWGIESPCSDSGGQCLIREIMKTKQPAVTRQTLKSGPGFTRHIETYAYPIFDISGNVVQIVKHIRHFQAARGSQAMRHESLRSRSRNEARGDVPQQEIGFLEKVINSLSHPFYVIDAYDYTIKMANKAARLGPLTGTETCYSLTHRRNEPCNSTLHPCPLDQVKRTGKPAIVEHEHYDEHNNIRLLEVHAYPVFDEQGSVKQIIEYDLDVTEQKWAEKQLETESKRARLYLDLLAHDMANQIQVISGGTELLHEIGLFNMTPEICENILKQLQESVTRCRSLISKARSTEQLVMAPMVERSLAKVLIESIQTMCERHDRVVVDFVCEVPEALVIADKFLEDMLGNLLDNAVEHNSALVKQIWVKLSYTEGGYFVSISDNGSGISSSKKEGIFDPSQRLGGLGLHFSTEIVEKYGGRLEVRDRVLHNADEGAEFLVWLPAKGGLAI
ncbi:MAG: ATP-binding protein [Candidatus Thorarchaeota archaeon]